MGILPFKPEHVVEVGEPPLEYLRETYGDYFALECELARARAC